MGKNEKTSPALAKLAAKVLQDKRYSQVAKRLAGAVLTQAPDKPKK